MTELNLTTSNRILGSIYVPPGSTTKETREIFEKVQTVAESGSRTIFVPKGTYEFDKKFTLKANMYCEPGAIIKKAKEFANEELLLVSTAGITIENLTVNGNRTELALGKGITWKGAGGIMRKCASNHNKSTGVLVEGSGAELTCYDCEASDNAAGTFMGKWKVSTAYSVGQMVENSAKFYICIKAMTTGEDVEPPEATHWTEVTNHVCDGFLVSGKGLLKTYGRTVANGNDRSGFFLLEGSANGCHVDGEANQNWQFGAVLRSIGGTSNNLVLNENLSGGIFLGAETAIDGEQWSFGRVEASKNGVEINNESGIKEQHGQGYGIEIFGSYGNRFGDVILLENPGYALAMSRCALKTTTGKLTEKSKTVKLKESTSALKFIPAHVGVEITGEHIPAKTTITKYISETEVEMSAAAEGAGTSEYTNVKFEWVPGASYNEFGTILADAGSIFNVNPGLIFAGACQGNTFGTVTIRKHTLAIVMGEVEAKFGQSSNNMIGTLLAEENSYGIWKITSGKNNRIGMIIGRDCYNKESSIAEALLWFKGEEGIEVEGNVVGSFSHRTVYSGQNPTIFKQGAEAKENVAMLLDDGSGKGKLKTEGSFEVSKGLAVFGSTPPTAQHAALKAPEVGIDKELLEEIIAVLKEYGLTK